MRNGKWEGRKERRTGGKEGQKRTEKDKGGKKDGEKERWTEKKIWLLRK